MPRQKVIIPDEIIPPENKKIGRPSVYTERVAQRICKHIVSGKSLNQICKLKDMPTVTTVYRWLQKHGEFSDMYARAREDAADTLADQIIAIADNPDLDHNQKRIMVDARKWIASKLKPRKYGDRVELAGDSGAPIRIVLSPDDLKL